ncbi:MAG: HlyD family secretion protein [Reyranella sp.]|uniref:HlyD family secretion protein n=1 Tax=Reyranella sp. TaxID=1929291 RepID=UPI003D14CF4E
MTLPGTDEAPALQPLQGERDSGGALVPTQAASLPVVQSSAKGTPFRWRTLLLVLLVATVAAAGGGYWWQHRLPPLPAGIAFSNGRLEADPLDIATKFAGRILELRVDEGDMVKAGQVLALMDTRDLEASLRKAEAQVEQATKAIVEAHAHVAQAHTQVVLAQQQMERAESLLKNGWITRELFDQRRQQLEGAQAMERAVNARVLAAEAALSGARHDVELYKVHIADNTLVAPRDGRIEYRIANVGEVLPAGGKVFTLLDVGYVYMDIYLPTATAGRVRIGNEGRIVLDAWPARPIPAKVSFIASQAQFTPKMVETQTERDKLMFRIRVRIDPSLSRSHAEAVRSGVPGVAYVRFDPHVAWPERLQGTP